MIGSFFGIVAVIAAIVGLFAGIGLIVVSLIVWPPAALVLVAFGLWVWYLIRKDRKEAAMEQRIETKINMGIPKNRSGKQHPSEWTPDPDLPSALD